MYALIADGLSSKRDVISINDILSIDFDRELYSSLFLFDKEIKNHVLLYNTVAGFNGNVYGNWFVLDIDGESLDHTASVIIPLLTDLENNSVKYYIFFSGRKGFHIYINKQNILYPSDMETKWNEVSKLFAEEISDMYNLHGFIDLSVYDKTRIFRYPFSKHPHGGNKQFLKWTGVVSGVSTDMFKGNQVDTQKIIKDIFFENKLDNPETWIEIKKVHKQKIIIQNNTAETEQRKINKLCIQAMMEDTVCNNRRHNVALRIMSHFANLGLSKEAVKVEIELWNNKLNNPLNDNEIEQIIKHYDKPYDYGCNDNIKNIYCKTKCPLYKRNSAIQNHIWIGADYYSRYKELLDEPKDNQLNLNLIYPELIISPIIPSHGHTCVIAAASTVGKTTFISSIMLEYKTSPFLVFSYDMSGESFAEKMIKLANININDRDSVESFNTLMNNIITIDDPSIYIHDMRQKYRDIVNVMGIRPKYIIVDYIQTIPVKNNSATERAITIAKEFNDIAKNEKVAIIALSQVPKEIAQDGSCEIPLYAAKDSGAIVDLADKVINLWRPYLKTNNDTVLRALVAKDRQGISNSIANLHWDVGGKVTSYQKEQHA